MSIRSRLERLERLEHKQPSGVSIWDVIWGTADVADLDDNGKAIWQQMLEIPNPVPDTIEEMIDAALAGTTSTPASSSSPGPPLTNSEDDLD
jgi:hypothetical protein